MERGRPPPDPGSCPDIRDACYCTLPVRFQPTPLRFRSSQLVGWLIDVERQALKPALGATRWRSGSIASGYACCYEAASFTRSLPAIHDP